jgi:hypothetical protein
MDSKLERQKERRAKAKAEWKAYKNTPDGERKEQKRQLDILIKKEKKVRAKTILTSNITNNIKERRLNH